MKGDLSTMTLSSISSVSTIPDSSFQSGVQQRRSEFRQLAQALQSGDLGAAQSAYDTLTQNSSSKTPQSNPNNVLAQDFAALGKSVQSGDLSGGQQAFAKLQKDATSISSSGSAQAAHGTH